MKVSIFARLVSMLLVGIISVLPIGRQNAEMLENDRLDQISRIESLEDEYESGKRVPVDEGSFFDGDLQRELSNGLKYNELCCVATHNSYQKLPSESVQKIYKICSRLTRNKIIDRSGFDSANLIDQLDSGIRSIELDVEPVVVDGKVSFTCIHSPVVDNPTNSYSFELALEEIKIWSEHNPNHLPITVLIEPKTFCVPLENMDFFNFKYCQILDSELKEIMGDKLFTPGDMLRNYTTFADMRRADDWCRVKDMLGKVMFALHYEPLLTDKYIKSDKTLRTQSMFPTMKKGDGQSQASIIIVNSSWNVESDSKKLFDENNYVVRTMADEAGNIDDMTRDKARNSKAQIVSTDYPPVSCPTDCTPFTFANGKTMKSTAKLK